MYFVSTLKDPYKVAGLDGEDLLLHVFWKLIPGITFAEVKRVTCNYFV